MNKKVEQTVSQIGNAVEAMREQTKETRRQPGSESDLEKEDLFMSLVSAQKRIKELEGGINKEVADRLSDEWRKAISDLNSVRYGEIFSTVAKASVTANSPEAQKAIPSEYRFLLILPDMLLRAFECFGVTPVKPIEELDLGDNFQQRIQWKVRLPNGGEVEF